MTLSLNDLTPIKSYFKSNLGQVIFAYRRTSYRNILDMHINTTIEDSVWSAIYYEIIMGASIIIPLSHFEDNS
jgi:hypothetical protein